MSSTSRRHPLPRFTHVRGAGCIVQLEKGKPKSRCRRWQLRISCGKDFATGKYVCRTRRVAGTYTEAAGLLRAFIAEVEGCPAARDRASFSEECERFCAARKASGSFSASRIRNVETCLRAACMHLGGVVFSDVTPEMVDAMVAAMRAGQTMSGKPASGSYAKAVVKQVGLVYKQAMREGRVAANPCEAAIMPRDDAEPRRAMADVELSAFVARLDPADEHGQAWLLAAGMGLRRGEICGLSWGDVDLGGRVLHVRHGCERGGALKATKTAAGRRVLPLSRQMAEALAAHRAAQEACGLACGPSSPVVVNRRGTRVSPDLLEKWWRRDRGKLGAGAYCLHELRHSYLTALARAGVHPRVMQELAGHASSRITMDIYTHVDMAGKREAAEVLAASLGPRPAALPHADGSQAASRP